MRSLPIRAPWRIPLATLALLTGSACGSETPAPEARQSSPAGSVTQALPSTVAEPGGMDHPPGVEARPGPALTGLVGWRGKGKDSAELGREHAGRADLAERVEQLLGRNPFRVATVAGELPTARGLQRELATALRSVSPGDLVTALVMPSLPAQAPLETHLRGLGGKVLRLASRNVYVVKAPAAALERMSRDPLVYWVGQLPWDKKLEPLLSRHLGIRGAAPGAGEATLAEPGRAVIALYTPEDESAVRRVLETLGVTIDSYDAGLGTFQVSGLDAGRAERIAALPEVGFIDALRIHQGDLSTSVTRSGNLDVIRDNYGYGANVTLGMIDSGFEVDHSAFMGWSPYPVLYALGWNVSGEGYLWDDNPSGHGTHVAGIMLSRWYGASLAGVAPRSGGDADHRFRIVRTGKDNDTNHLSFYNTLQAMDLLANDNGAEVINCSWSSNTSTGTDTNSIKADDIAWNKGQIYAFAAGNDGTSPGTINSPAAAKNVIAVGSLDNDWLSGRSSSSSEGPTSDQRQKPDIYAIGGNVTSAHAANLYGSITMSGTSMATPHVTGFLGTLLDHYPEFKRRPALAKALLIASAAPRSGVPARTGGLNGHDAHFASSTTGSLWGWRDTDPRQYSYTYWDVTIPSGVTRMNVVLTWTEPAASIGATHAVVNDVDLYVDFNRDSDGYGEWASTSVNDNVELVQITNPPAGSYRISARNYSVPTTYKPGYALTYWK